METENYFSDESVLEQRAVTIQKRGGKRTNGISCIVKCPSDVAAVEILLEYEELKAALIELEKDREIFSYLYE